MALGQGNLAGVARVAFEAQTGEFNQDISVAEARYRQATQGMSDDAIKLELAQERLRRALAKGPGAYREIANAELNLRRVQQGLRADTDRLTAAEDRNARARSHVRNRLIAYAGAYIGAQGIVYGIRQSLDAAREEELVLGQTQVALEAAGLSWSRYAERIEEAITAQSRFGFDDEELLKTFGIFVRQTDSVEEALERNALAADVARGRYLSLEAAAKLVTRASLGQAGALRRIGLDAKDGATGVELLAFLTREYGNAAEEAATTGIAAQDRLNVSLENAREIIGRGLLPSVAELSDRIVEYLGDAENQRALQERVNAAVATGEKVVRGLAGGLRIVHGAAAPVIDALGGIENAVQLALIVGIVGRARRAAVSLGLITAASSAMRTKMIADAAAIGTALDVATRPRNVVITTTGVPGGTTVAGAPARGGRRGIPPALAGNLPTAVAVAAVISAGGGTQRGDRSGQYPLTFDAVGRAASGIADPEELAILKAELGQYSLANAPDDRMRAAERRLRAYRARRGPPPTDANERSDAGSPSAGGAGGRGGGGRNRRTIADIELDLARAGTTRGRGDDARVLRELRGRLEGEIRILERRKTLTEEQRDRLRTLYGQIASVQSQLDSIADEAEQAEQERRERAQERREKKREEHERRMRRIREAAARQAERRQELFEGISSRTGTRAGLRALALRGVKATVAGVSDEEDDRRREFARMAFEFLGSLQGIGNQFGSNVFPPGALEGITQTAMHSYAQTELIRDQNRILERAIGGVRFAGTQYSRSELAAAGTGSGF